MTLVRHLAGQFAAHPENLAIEALHYLIQGSPVARDALVHLLETATGSALPSGLHFVTQDSGIDLARPDLAGRDSSGTARVIIETKFWAGLTDHQPVTYFRRLPSEGPGALVFVAPEARLATLWGELLARSRQGGIELGDGRVLPAVRAAPLNADQYLLLTSWRAVLTAISEAAALTHDLALANDTAQLEGLCDQMDSEAFLPLRAEELSATEIPRRLLQYARLVTEIGDEAISQGLCSLRGGLRPGYGLGYSGRYLRLGSALVFLTFDCSLWAQHGSPLWLRLDGDAECSAHAIRAGLGASLRDPLSRTFEENGRVLIPIALPTGCEKTRVIGAALSQLRQIAALLPAAPPSGSPA